ncbi:MAG: B12-binding domain-containing radical SAM protein [Syntrophorhabdaceae bacterium]|nr:B12-binding domain-containing radical SAM protein [Syntrophorhabdaceae bacterium]
MRILFIYPNLNTQVGFNYGISYISGFLKAKGIETGLLNISEKLGYPLDRKRIKKDVLAFGPDLIGFSVLTNQYKYALEIARDIKGYTDVPILFGGIHVTMDPVETLMQDEVDLICVGEGEEALAELVATGNPKGVANIGRKENGKAVIEPLRPFTDITTLPFKDYEIFDFQKIIDAKDGWVGLTASRGCPFRCTYCLNHKIIEVYKESGHLPRGYIRRHTVDQMIAEIEYLLAHYERIKMFIFDDDIFTFDKAWLREFTDRYASVTDIPFVCNAHARIFDDETAGMLSGAGCRIVKFGLESGSDRIRRKVLSRYMTNKHIEDAFAIADKYGLHTSAFVMLGLPHETIADIRETVDLLAAIKPGRFRWSLFFPFVGTKAYSIARSSGQIDPEQMEKLDNFTDETCMRLGPEVDLYCDKVKSILCAFVNARSGLEHAEGFRRLVEEIEAMDEAAWHQKKESILRAVEELNEDMEKSGGLHYTVRYNPFMGVRSDWKDDSISA